MASVAGRQRQRAAAGRDREPALGPQLGGTAVIGRPFGVTSARESGASAMRSP